jgi:hypothetical protein
VDTNDPGAAAPEEKIPSTALTISVEAEAAPEAEAAATAPSGVWSRVGSFSRTSVMIAGVAVVVALAGGAFIANGTVWHAPDQTNTARAEDEIKALRATVAQLNSEVKALRGANETTKTAAAQIGKLTDRLDRFEHGQPDPAKVAKALENIDKLDQKLALLTANDATGSVSAKAAAVSAPAPTPAPVATTPPAARQTVTVADPPIVTGWEVRRVYDGLALIHSRWGTMEVGPGDVLPGGMIVKDIRRLDGRWVVLTTRGLIVSSR